MKAILATLMILTGVTGLRAADTNYLSYSTNWVLTTEAYYGTNMCFVDIQSRSTYGSDITIFEEYFEGDIIIVGNGYTNTYILEDGKLKLQKKKKWWHLW